MPPKGWKKDTIQPISVETSAPELGTPQVHQPVSVDIVQNPIPEPVKQVIQPVSVEYGQPAKPSRTSQPVKSQPHKTGAFLVDKLSGNKRTWMDRAMANLMAKSNPKKYKVED